MPATLAVQNGYWLEIQARARPRHLSYTSGSDALALACLARANGWCPKSKYRDMLPAPACTAVSQWSEAFTPLVEQYPHGQYRSGDQDDLAIGPRFDDCVVRPGRFGQR